MISETSSRAKFFYGGGKKAIGALAVSQQKSAEGRDRKEFSLFSKLREDPC